MRRFMIVVTCVVLVAACGQSQPDTASTTTPPATTTPASTTSQPTTIPNTTTSGPPTTTTTTPTTSSPTTTTAVPPDTTPPELTVTDPTRGAIVATRTYRFRGSTEPGAAVMAAGRYQADVDADGDWSIVLVLSPGGNVATFTATDPAGNATEVTVSVFYAPRLTIADAVAIAQARLDALWAAVPPVHIGAIEISCGEPDRAIAEGDVFTCEGIGRIPATMEIGRLAFLVLDENGTTSMLAGSDLPDLEAAYATAPHGLLCRDLLTDKAAWPFNVAGTTEETAAFLATAYWFLEGRPDRMDADHDGIPCGTVLSEESIAWVWNGGLLTGGYGLPEVSIIAGLHRRDNLPSVPAGSRLVDFTFNLSGGPAVLIETPDGGQLWQGPGGDASWRVETLPDAVFAGAHLATIAVLADATYVVGSAPHLVPAVWRRDSDATWTEIRVEDQPGIWGELFGIEECGGDVVFTGHHSASNQVLDYKIWRLAENGDLEDVFSRGGGPPGSGTPPPAVYCHDGNFMALVTFGHPPDAGGDFTYSNEIWSSPDGSDWSLVADDTIHPAIIPWGGVARGGSDFWVVSDGDIATSSDGVHWTRIDCAAAGIEPDDEIGTMFGGNFGLLLVGDDHPGDPVDPVMWWTWDGHHWERLDDHPALDPWGVAVVIQPTGLMIAIRRSFEEGAPVMWVSFAAG